MLLDRWRPSRTLMRTGGFGDLEREMSELFDRAFRSWLPTRGEPDILAWSPAVDLTEHEGDLVLRVDLPGVKQKDVQLSVEEGTLTIRGMRGEKKDRAGQNYYACERWSGSFTRSVALPLGVDVDKVSAVFSDGVLEVRLPRTTESRGRNIEVRTK